MDFIILCGLLLQFYHPVNGQWRAAQIVNVSPEQQAVAIKLTRSGEVLQITKNMEARTGRSLLRISQ